ncbi:hypothetical protein C5B42_04185 [Candidatus Cerribacteria bacterium 'Amazon FNV 2010 28 9']|uniref:Uncharacterized protein n=1 Tax=Candidatus Cerribacteria bacterium 'Amazon FNV 2010 28 9' TaxID=2081795 RepID=A0A317JPB9_9BACT|nr:MAG: hypothetical protein C5B42_04185 [Candidatus Cerribacteria bacterium 'Amazon FNV 2010 28 9']
MELSFINEEMQSIACKMISYAKEDLGIHGAALVCAVDVRASDETKHIQSVGLSHVEGIPHAHKQNMHPLPIVLAHASANLYVQLHDPHIDESVKEKTLDSVAINLGSFVLIVVFAGGSIEQNKFLSVWGADTYIDAI